MTVWKTTILTAALAAAGALGAPPAPVIHAQTWVAAAPRAQRMTELVGSGGSEIGVTIHDLSEEDVRTAKLGSATGAAIVQVAENGPADRAGMKAGDIITEFDGERIRSARQFSRVVDETPSGRKVQATVVRDGQKKILTVQPREDRGGFRLLTGNAFPENFDRFFSYEAPTPPAAPVPPAPPAAPRAIPPPIPDFNDFLGRSSGRLGITIDELSGQLADYFGTKDGVLVTSVYDDSAAAKAGLKAGDVITSVNGEPVTSASELRRRIQRLDEGAEFTVGVVRDKKPMTLKGKLEARDTRQRTYKS